jgi:hypothetical protein
MKFFVSGTVRPPFKYAATPPELLVVLGYRRGNLLRLNGRGEVTGMTVEESDLPDCRKILRQFRRSFILDE